MESSSSFISSASRTRFLAIIVFGLLGSFASAHPEPDIPVRSHFQKDGSCVITVEVDPRCFTQEPIYERYKMKIDLQVWSPEKIQEWKAKAADAVKRWVDFQFEPALKEQPVFEWAFTGLDQAPLVNVDDTMVLTGTWKTKLPAATTGWRIHATKETPFAIIFRNYLEGVEQERFSVLFPGETSFRLELTTAAQ